MSVHNYQPAKLFTLEQANAMLPLVRAITSDAVQLAREIIDRRRRLDKLTEGRDMESGDPYDDELTEMKTELDQDTERLHGYIDELKDLGVEPKNFPEGLIDFPSDMDGRIVFLCWKLDEPEIQHWHELDGGFAGRQPLVTVAVGDEGGAESHEP